MADEAGYGRFEWGKNSLIYRGFEFYRHLVKADGQVVWRCSKCRVLKFKTNFISWVDIVMLDLY